MKFTEICLNLIYLPHLNLIYLPHLPIFKYLNVAIFPWTKGKHVISPS